MRVSLTHNLSLCYGKTLADLSSSLLSIMTSGTCIRRLKPLSGQLKKLILQRYLTRNTIIFFIYFNLVTQLNLGVKGLDLRNKVFFNIKFHPLLFCMSDSLLRDNEKKFVCVYDRGSDQNALFDFNKICI